MDTKTVILRLAQQRDATAIWHLLHSDSKAISMERIIEDPGKYYVLWRGTKLLAVCDNTCTDADQVREIIVHPLYPRQLLAEAMSNMLKVLFKINKPSKSGSP